MNVTIVIIYNFEKKNRIYLFKGQTIRHFSEGIKRTVDSDRCSFKILDRLTASLEIKLISFG